MFSQKPVPDKSKNKDPYETQENPIVITRPLSNIPIIVGNLNLDEEDEYKTEPFRSDKKPQ